MRSLVLSTLLGGSLALVSVPVEAFEADRTAAPDRVRPPRHSTRSLSATRLIGSFGFGRGVRFNNPYRLATQLDDDPQGLSLTATYADFGFGTTFGSANGIQHGAVAHLSLAMGGVRQEVASLSYALLTPFGSNGLLWSRAGVPLVFEPDTSPGLELALGLGYFMSAGLGLSAELVSSLFFGAATWEHDPSVIPVVSFQIGGFLQYELLP